MKSNLSVIQLSNDEVVLPRLRSITLGQFALSGDDTNYRKSSTNEHLYRNELTMKGTCDTVVPLIDLPSLTELQGDGSNFYVIGTVSLKSGGRLCFRCRYPQSLG